MLRAFLVKRCVRRLDVDAAAAWASDQPYDKADDREDQDAENPEDFRKPRSAGGEDLIDRVDVCDQDNESEKAEFHCKAPGL